MEVDRAVCVLMEVTVEQLDGTHLQSGFFQAFSHGCIRWLFTIVHFAAREFPVSRQLNSRWALADQERIAVFDDRNGYLPGRRHEFDEARMTSSKRPGEPIML
jgi:hypothetical protein